MGRRKLEIKLIEDKNSRHVTFSKRRTGLIKKARELSILCDVEVALLVFSSRGRLYQFCSGNSLTSVLERYQNHSEEDKNLKVVDTQGSSSQYGGRSHAELLQLVQRLIDDPDADTFSVKDLVELEKDITAALVQTRSRKTQLMMESLMSLKEQERLMREENELRWHRCWLKCKREMRLALPESHPLHSTCSGDSSVKSGLYDSPLLQMIN